MLLLWHKIRSKDELLISEAFIFLHNFLLFMYVYKQIFLSALYHFHLVHRQLDISREITVKSSSLHPICLRLKKQCYLAYHFYVKTKILVEFQICISVPLGIPIILMHFWCSFQKSRIIRTGWYEFHRMTDTATKHHLKDYNQK